METIQHYQGIVKEICEKIGNHEPLTCDDKIDFYLAVHRIYSRLSHIETSLELKTAYLREADVVLKKAQRLERRFGLNI